ncbi:MAG TPA: phosphodiester glycosidase family protein [Candidatus Acidoferrales bacterium]|nr:phosphodiester glycosidase family protein [Candidatus Acidoferrales bacterium]
MAGVRSARRLATLCIGAFVLYFSAFAQSLGPAQDKQGDVHEQREPARGVRYTHVVRATPAGEPWSIHVVEVSRNEKKIVVRSVQGAGDENGMKREPPTEMARRAAASGLNVVAVVNGDYDLPAPYFGVSDGLSVTNGFVSTTGKPTWPAMAVTSSGEPLIGVPQVEIVLESRGRNWPIAALNKPPGTTWGTGPHLYTREFRAGIKTEQPVRAVVIGELSKGLPLRADGSVTGKVEKVIATASDVALPAGRLVLTEVASKQTSLEELRVGDKVKLRIRVQMNGQKKIRDVVGGFPILVEGGKKHIVGEPRASLAQRHPRTAVCYNAQKIIFVVVDGRQPKLSVGMTLDELADLMVELGCATAMNTDGGGSSVMAVALPAGSLKPGAISDTVETSAEKLNVKGTTGAAIAIVNSPSDGQERGRGNAWIVVRK